MDFWNKKVNVSEEAARRQVEIYSTFPPEKRLNIALEFANMGIEQTRKWIRSNHPYWSELEITLEFVRLVSYETDQISREHWYFFRKTMLEKIRKDWSRRFRAMMQERNLTYSDIANMGNFKNAGVIKATISRGLPAFARMAVILHEDSA